MVRGGGRGGRRRRRSRRPRQFLRYPIVFNIVQNGSHTATAGSIGIPNDRPARVKCFTFQFVLQKDPSVADAASFPLISVALRDGNGETDARSRVYLVGPTIGRGRVTMPRGTDFDHLDNSDTPLYINISNFPTGGILTLNGMMTVEFQDANLPSVLHSTVIHHDGRGNTLPSENPAPIPSTSSSVFSEPFNL